MEISNLGPGETAIATLSVRPSPLLFWLRVNMQASEKRIAGKAPNTIFGIIPAGYEDVMFPLKQVSGIGVYTKIRPARVIIGVLLFLSGLGFLAKGGIFFLLIGAALFISGLQAELVVQSSGGGKQGVSVSLLDKTSVVDFATKVKGYLIDL